MDQKTKSEIISLLTANHNRFMSQFVEMDEIQFTASRNGKWDSSQQLDHIIRSVRPVVLAFSLPTFILKLLFGKANRPSRSYDELIEKYLLKLSAGGMASGRFIPKSISLNEKQRSLKKLGMLVENLNRQIERTTEQTLDSHILPHPLLGKLTLREMLLFTAYHAEHHWVNILKNLKG